MANDLLKKAGALTGYLSTGNPISGLVGYGIGSLLSGSSNKSSSNTNNNPALTGSAIASYLPDYSTLNYNNMIENQLSGYKDALNAAQSGTRAIDLSGIIADYNRNNQATIDTYNKALENTINTLNAKNQQSRNDLLTSLKRFQESNAESMKIQQQDYNSARATLEDESFMNQRNSVANAAARGLGGSGLQQLAQLQNRLAAGKNVNTLALKNQNAQDSLRKALKQEQEDYDTKVSNLETNLANAIIQAQDETAAKINAANTNNTNLINNLIYNEQVRQANARSQANNAANALAQARADLQNRYNSGVNSLKSLERQLELDLKNTKSKSAAKQLLNDALYDVYANYYDLGSDYTDLAAQRLNRLYNTYY